MRIAIMQPYFMPYAGYFRLFAAAELFVVYDCVQFPRRGWVHRNQLVDRAGNPHWLTLPLEKASRDTTRICDLQFRAAADLEWQAELARFPAPNLIRNKGFLDLTLRDCAPVEYIVSCLTSVAKVLSLERPMVLSSTLDIDPSLRAQDRIIAIAARLGASSYVNAPGGRALYDSRQFERAGISLNFLAEYRGSFASVLDRLAYEPAPDIAEEIRQNMTLDPAA